jgi:hypothetical protein
MAKYIRHSITVRQLFTKPKSECRLEPQYHIATQHMNCSYYCLLNNVLSTEFFMWNEAFLKSFPGRVEENDKNLDGNRPCARNLTKYLANAGHCTARFGNIQQAYGWQFCVVCYCKHRQRKTWPNISCCNFCLVGKCLEKTSARFIHLPVNRNLNLIPHMFRAALFHNIHFYFASHCT